MHSIALASYTTNKLKRNETIVIGLENSIKSNKLLALIYNVKEWIKGASYF